MIQTHTFVPVDPSEPAFESLEMCVDESARYDAPPIETRPFGIATRPTEPILQYQATVAFDYDNNRLACVDDDYVAPLLGLHSGANSLAQIFGATRNDLQDGTILSLLGIREPPAWTINENKPEPAKLVVFCLKPEHGAPCSNRCIANGLGCAPMHIHPYKSDAGWGKLFACNTLPIGYMCGFQFANGDACHVFFGTVFPSMCVYTGGD